MSKRKLYSLSGLFFDILFSAVYLVFGILTRSWWLLTLCSYYLILSSVRFAVIVMNDDRWDILKFTGKMLMLISLPLAGTVMLSLIRDRGHEINMILMIAIAAYTFTKITLSSVNLVRLRRSGTARHVAEANISFADSLASIFALQRSMLATFEGMDPAEIMIMNAFLGIGVLIAVFLLGVNLVKKENENSKLRDITE